MEKRQIWGLFALLAITAAVIGAARPMPPEQADASTEGEAGYEELLAATPVAELEGEPVSPNGRFEIRTEGKSGNYVSGLVPPEKLQIADARTGEVKWEDNGYLRQSALWSPGNNLVALAYSGRNWTQVKVISTAYWTSWDFTLPDGSAIPEYTFLPEDWGEWLDPATLLLTVGRGGDGEEQRTYRCLVDTHQEQITGSTLEQTTETLPGNYDFDHDGAAETVELVTVLTPETPDFPAWYELRVKRPDGGLLWMQDAALAHVGWVSVFACEVDGQDYLLRYCPWAGQGWAEYRYKLFALDGADPGEERTLRESTVVWDCNFPMEGHQLYLPALTDFLAEVRGYLDGSTLLMSMEGGEFRTGGSGALFDDGFLEQWQLSEGDAAQMEELLTAWELENWGEQGLL